MFITCRKTTQVTRSFLVIQSVSLTSAALEAFAEACLCFLVSASAAKKKKKKNAVAIKFLGILKKYVSPKKKKENQCFA